MSLDFAIAQGFQHGQKQERKQSNDGTGGLTMRIIDAEKYRDVLFRCINSPHVNMKHYYSEGLRDAFKSCIELLEDAPTIDAVPVLRCKDCKYYRNHPNGLCYAWTEPKANAKGYDGDAHCVDQDDFCSCGERKDNGTD